MTKMKVRWYHWTPMGLGIPVLMIAAYGAFVEWDVGRVKAICRKIRPGSSMNSARSIIRSRGLGQYLPDPNSDYPNGVLDQGTGAWFFAAPAGSTMGDWACGISNDGGKVLSTTLLDPSDY